MLNLWRRLKRFQGRAGMTANGQRVIEQKFT
jgi:hypothetical protein